MGRIRLGIGKRDITPVEPVPLAGFASRQGNYEGVERRLYVRAWLLTQEEAGKARRSVLIVQGDLVGWDAEWSDRVKGRLAARWNIPTDHMLFHASHTHGGPQTLRDLNPIIGVAHPDYLLALEAAVEKAVADAHHSLEQVEIWRGLGVCEGISVNRRLQVNGATEMMPNPDGVNDTEVTVIRFATLQGGTKGVLFHFACHPTTSSRNNVTSEFVGAAMERLDEQYGEGVSCFLQGCCGDIRPDVQQDGRFVAGDEAIIDANGRQLADAVMTVMQGAMEPVGPAPLAAWTSEAALPLQPGPSPEQLQPDEGDSAAIRQWKQCLLHRQELRHPYRTLRLQLIRLGANLSLLALNGEIVVEYGLRIKALAESRILPLGYSNGIIGYVPTAAQIREGGYESADSHIAFALPAPFALDAEDQLMNAIHVQLARLQ